MREIQASELEERLPGVLSDVEQGGTVVITRLIPELAEAEAAGAKPDFVKTVEEFRRQLPPTGITVDEILAWRHEGHKY